MANKRITELTLRSEFSDTCNIPIDDTIQSYRTTGLQLYNYMSAKGMVSLYDATKTYAINEYAISGGHYYKSLQNSNTSNTPASSPTYWKSMPFFGVAALIANYTITDTDGYRDIGVTTGASDYTITLPAAANNKGRDICFVKSDTGTGKLIIGGTVNGETNYNLYMQNDSVTVCSDGTSWYIKHKNLVINGFYQWDGGNGFGSTDTWIRKYSSQTVDLGRSMSFTTFAVTGAKLTCAQRGSYRIFRLDSRAGGLCTPSITKNIATGLGADHLVPQFLLTVF
jgi:hypothetical protein